LIAAAEHLPASGDAVPLKSGFLVEVHHLRCGFQANALNVAKGLQGVLPEATANSLTPILWLHHKQADEGVAGAVGDGGDASHWHVVLPGQPDPLTVGVGVDLDVAHSWSEILFTGDSCDYIKIGWRERFDLQHRQSGEGSAT